MRQKSLSAQFCCSATLQESNALSHSFLRSSAQRRETLQRSSASSLLSSARSSISESICFRARFACEPTIAQFNGFSQRIPKRRQESPDSLRRSWSTRCKSSTCAAFKTRSQTRCLVSTQYLSMLRSLQSSQEASRPTLDSSQKSIASTRAPTESRSTALTDKSHE